jgi:DNA invertase Pin-like site-specific DNA recombinase
MERHGSTEKPAYKAKNSVNLSEEDVRRIKKLHVGFVTKTKIGREFNISPQTVTRVLKGDFD